MRIAKPSLRPFAPAIARPVATAAGTGGAHSIGRQGPTPARTARTARVLDLTQGPRHPAAMIRVHGAAADLMLPLPPGQDARAAFESWRSSLLASGIFNDRPAASRQAILDLTFAGVEAVPVDRPTVGVVAATLEEMVSNKLHVHLDRARAMGCHPVIIPPVADAAFIPPGKKQPTGANRELAVRGLLGPLCGLIGPGGDDMHPSLYGAADRGTESPDKPRDLFQRHLGLRAMSAQMAVFAICRSHQLWNVARGGFMIQDLPTSGLVNTRFAHRQAKFGVPEDEPFVVFDERGDLIHTHDVVLAAGSDLAARTVGAPTADDVSVETNSIHHQLVLRAGKGLRPTAHVVDKTTGQRLIEGTESWNTVTTQWHPEEMTDAQQQALYGSFFARAWAFHALRAAQADGVTSAAAVADRVANLAFANDPVTLAWVRDVLPAYVGLQ